MRAQRDAGARRHRARCRTARRRFDDGAARRCGCTTVLRDVAYARGRPRTEAAVDGDEQRLRDRDRGGRDDRARWQRPVRSASYQPERATIGSHQEGQQMSVMRKAMVYLGLVDDEEFYADDDVYYADDDATYEDERAPARAGRREHAAVA